MEPISAPSWSVSNSFAALRWIRRALFRCQRAIRRHHNCIAGSNLDRRFAAISAFWPCERLFGPSWWSKAFLKGSIPRRRLLSRALADGMFSIGSYLAR